MTERTINAQVRGRPARSRWLNWLPLSALPLAVIAARPLLPPWATMWAMAFALFFGFKWLTMQQALAGGIRTSQARRIAYLLLWPGMDPEAFLGARRVPSRPSPRAWLVAAGQTLLGALLLWGVASAIPDRMELLKGWTGLAGLAFLLHFGSFQLIALFWQRVGVDARPIMQSPLRATSLGAFWGWRWNAAFRQLAHRLIFLPLRPRIGVPAATLAAFLASGLVHELVISLPAGSGFGLPTAYFLVQALGLLLERSPLCQRLGPPSRLIGWLVTMTFAGGPAFWLFHPPFIARVALPFLAAIGAL